jgi:hypothetical protein
MSAFPHFCAFEAFFDARNAQRHLNQQPQRSDRKGSDQ